MLKFYSVKNEILQTISLAEVKADQSKVVWADIFNPNREEEVLLESILKTEVPTHYEMHEIELSSRLYQKNGALYCTAFLITNSESDEPELHSITFILKDNCLATVRYSEPKSFKNYAMCLEKVPEQGFHGNTVFAGLIEFVVDRLADFLDKISHNLDALASTIFGSKLKTEKDTKIDFEAILKEIGRNGNSISKSKESLISINRMLGFVHQTNYFKLDSDECNRVATMIKDVSALTDHSSFLSNKVNFLLDASLGMIGIQQNAIIKIFSVAAVIFLPPTLIASIYGMNFASMPELSWGFGYPFAVILMIISAYIPYKLFKKNNWL
jgi:magnesium transporter